MILFDHDKEINIPLKKRITPKLKVDFSEQYSKIEEYEATKLLNEGLTGIEYVLVGEEYQTKVTDPKQASKILQAQNKPLEPEKVKNNDKIYVELIKLILEPTEEHKELLSQEFESDFWQEQDINSIISEVRSFRQRIIA